MIRRFHLASLVAALLVATSVGLAMSGTDRISHPVTADEATVRGWPNGSLAVMNDPLRVAGYHPWFTELPNATYYFGYRADSTDDVNRLIGLLSKIQGTEVLVELSPLDGSRTGMDPKVGAAAAQLTMCSQRDLDGWFNRLSADGRVKFQTFAAPLASPPTLTVYLANPKVDPAKLRVPPAVKVANGATIRDRQEAVKDRQLADRIDLAEQMVGRHKVDQLAAPPTTKPTR